MTNHNTDQSINAPLRLLPPLLFPLARAMLTATFIISAIRHLTHWSAALDEMAGDGMPRSSVLLLGSIAFRLLGGFSVLVGFRARYGAALLVAFIVPAAVLAHDFWVLPAARQTHEMIEFLNNIAIAAGAMFVALNGPGSYSIDCLKSDRLLSSARLTITTSEPQ